MKIRTKLSIGIGLPILLMWALTGWALYKIPSPALFIEMAVIATLAAAATGAMMVRSVLYRIQKLQEGAKRIAGGDLSGRINATGSDEMAQLCRAFDEMTDRLAHCREDMESKLRAHSEKITADLKADAERRRELEDSRLAMEKVMDNLRLKQAELVDEVNHRKLAEARLRNRVEEVEILNKGMTNLLEDLQEASRLQSRTTEQLKQANKELESFSYSVSHDLRAPLRAIKGFAEALSEEFGDKIGETGRHYIEVITRNARSMGQLIEDLLAFSRLGRKPLERVMVDIDRMVRETIEECRPDPAQRSVAFQLEPLPPAQADPALMRQVWINLISNAVKFTGRKKHAVIKIWSFEENGQTVYAIRDNGVGFSMDHVDKIFGVFQRLHRPEDFEGTGVGLAIVQRIIERHGGTIRAEGKENEGAAFFFTIPAP